MAQAVTNNRLTSTWQKRNLLVLFLALNVLDAALTVLGLSNGAQELNPLWNNYPPLYSMGLKLGLAVLTGLWFYRRGWWLALLAGNAWLTMVVTFNLITLVHLL